MSANPQRTDANQGLSANVAAAQLQAEGYNELPAPEQRSFVRILREVIQQPMFALLLGGGLIYLLLGDRIEAVLLLVFACLSVTITLVQESRSENVLAALRNLASPRALVIRDGKRVCIAGREVVRDDLLVVTEGDRIAADATLITADDLLVDESLLTGESVAVRKQVAAAVTPVPGGEDSPHLYAGTLVVRGTGLARVHAIGIRSEMGRIGRALQSIETTQPHLQIEIAALVRKCALFGAIAGVATVLLYGLLRGSWLNALLSGIALGMSLLPEEFPLVMAVFMAMGAWRISQARVLTRRAAAIETLGATTVLCTDKTGTLTENQMTVVAVVGKDAPWRFGKDTALSNSSQQVLHSALLACAREPTDPMDVAVHALAALQTAAPLGFTDRQLIRAYGLRPDLFAVANIWLEPATPNEGVAYAKGALEAIAELCAVSGAALSGIRQQVDTLAQEGIRVLAVARSATINLATAPPESLREIQFAYLGLIGFADPLRANVPAAIAECRSAGIRVMIITGDYPATARAIALQAGLQVASVVSGADIEAMSDDQLTLSVRTANVFARIRPNQKLRIVQSLKAQGEVVAMTGDGVNDAPAIKAAHIGIAMGGRGTDVAREAASIVLLDDDFGSIVKTIRLGRRIHDNLRKAVEYIVAVHIPIAGLALLPLLLGLPLILTPILIAFLEMVIDPACSVVLEAETEEADVMRRPPRNPTAPLLLPRRAWWAVMQGLLVLGVLAAVLINAARMQLPEPELRAVVFASLVLMNMGLILVNRSFSASLVRAMTRPNRSLWLLLGSVGALLTAALLWPPLQSLFHIGQMNARNLLIAVLASVACVLMLEALKSRWFRLQPLKSLQLTRE